MAHDHYRILGYAEHNTASFNVCFTDVSSCVALGQIVEGPIVGFETIEAAETALNALLFHLNVEVFIPTLKVEVNGMRTYARPDTGTRSQLVFDLFNIARTRDWLCAYDYALVTHGKISRTEKRDTRLRHVEYGDFRKFQTISAPRAADVIAGLALDFKMPGYFSDRHLIERYKSPQTFTHELYDRMEVPWKACVASVPGAQFNIEVPPLLSVVLDRAASRTEIPDVIRALHDELGPVRYELFEFNQLIHSKCSQAELERKAARIKEAFIAIVPEAKADVGQRALAKCWELAKVLAKGYATAIHPVAIDGAKVVALLDEASQVVMNNTGRLVDRTMSSRKFARLLRTKSVHSIIRKHFTEAEIRTLEKTI
jgi:hypothetical protein